MNSIAPQNRFNPISNEFQPLAETTHPSASRKRMAIKAGVTALCGAALATQFIASVTQGNPQPNRSGSIRMLTRNQTEVPANQTDVLANQTDPCAEFNTGEDHYVPFNRDLYKKTGLIIPGLFGLAAVGSFLMGAAICTQMAPEDSAEESVTSGCAFIVCAAINAIVFGFMLSGYFKQLELEDGDCVIQPKDMGASRG